MLTFLAALNHANKILGDSKSKALLLGNGFSRACSLANTEMNNDVFNYTNLMSVIQRTLPNGRNIQDFFDLTNTTNFENLLHELLTTNTIMQFIRGKQDVQIETQINQYYREIQYHLGEAITHIHPTHQYVIADESYKRVGEFFKEFDFLFTINYDLLLYWAIRSRINKHHRYKYKDGFCISSPEERNCLYWDFNFKDISFYFLHGAIHLYKDEEDNPYKLTNISLNNWLMLNVIQRINQRLYPLIVIEGKSENKLRQIRENPYLNMCLNSLERINGILFTYGISFEFDQHIIDALRKNKSIRQVYIGIFNDDHAPTKRLENIGKELFEYNATEFNPWLF